MFSTVYPRCLNKACILSESTVQPHARSLCELCALYADSAGTGTKTASQRETAPGQRVESDGTRAESGDGRHQDRR